MSNEKLILFDPKNQDQINRIKLFENENNIGYSILEYNLNKEDNPNEIDEVLLLESDSQIKDYCHIQGEKDIKACRISFPNINIRRKKIITLVTNYAQDILGSEEVFIKVQAIDKQAIRDLTSQEFESLGEEDGIIIFLKEREKEASIQRKV